MKKLWISQDNVNQYKPRDMRKTIADVMNLSIPDRIEILSQFTDMFIIAAKTKEIAK